MKSFNDTLSQHYFANMAEVMAFAPFESFVSHGDRSVIKVTAPQIEVTLICASLASDGYQSLYTLQLKYPRFIHSELMTHRVFSRNASSSRAIPVTRMLDMISENCARPIYWGMNQSGMAADQAFPKQEARGMEDNWLCSAKSALEQARYINSLGVHKQVVNRLIEPYQHINVIVTATQWDNFFNLRIHEKAQPEILMLAKCMKKAIAIAQQMGTPRNNVHCVSHLGLHLPYIDLARDLEALHEFNRTDTSYLALGFSSDLSIRTKQQLIAMSAARCARVSYANHEGKKPTVEEDLKLFRILIVEQPMHASPIEHQAIMQPERWYLDSKKRIAFVRPKWYSLPRRGLINCNNFTGWMQARYMFETMDMMDAHETIDMSRLVV